MTNYSKKINSTAESARKLHNKVELLQLLQSAEKALDEAQAFRDSLIADAPEHPSLEQQAVWARGVSILMAFYGDNYDMAYNAVVKKYPFTMDRKGFLPREEIENIFEKAYNEVITLKDGSKI